MKKWTLAALLACTTVGAQAASLTVDVNEVSANGVGKKIGTVSIEPSAYGLVFTPNLTGLKPGIHGFHIHTNPSCDAGEKEGKLSPAEMAGGHWDPDKAGRHGAPWEDNAHKGELPALYVTDDGKATQPVLAPRLKTLDEIKGHALMVHAGGDNHSDHPLPLGGGGARAACGVIR